MPPPTKQKKSETAPKTIKRKKKATEPLWLPDELFQEVFKYLPWSSLNSCRLVSRKWKGLVDHSSVLKCAAMNVIQQENIEERLQCELIKFVGKVNLKQPYNLVLIDEYTIYLKENSIKADLTEVQEVYASLCPYESLPNLVVSMVKSKNSTHVSTHLEVKDLGSGESAAEMAKMIERMANGEVTVESLDLYDFDVTDDEFEYIRGENGAEYICEQFGKNVSGPEYFIELLVKAVCMCKEVTLTNRGDPRGGEVGAYQPMVMNEILRGVAKTPSTKLKLKKLEFNFWVDYELGVASNGGYGSYGDCLNANVFAAAVCKLEEVRFLGIPVDPELEEAMFKAIRDTPTESVVLKSLKIGFVTTKAQILASAALKLVDLKLNFASHKYAAGNRHEQCSQAKAILDRIHKAKTLRLENLEIGLYDKIHHGGYKTYYGKRKSWSYPQVKMEEIKAKLKNLKIDDQTNARDEEDSEDDEDNNCTLQ